MEARRKAPVSTHDFFGALVPLIDAITISTKIAASQAQEHQQWPMDEDNTVRIATCTGFYRRSHLHLVREGHLYITWSFPSCRPRNLRSDARYSGCVVAEQRALRLVYWVTNKIYYWDRSHDSSKKFVSKARVLPLDNRLRRKLPRLLGSDWVNPEFGI